MTYVPWKERVQRIVEAMPVGQEFTAIDITGQFNSRGPSCLQVGSFLSRSNLVVHGDRNNHAENLTWRRV